MNIMLLCSTWLLAGLHRSFAGEMARPDRSWADQAARPYQPRADEVRRPDQPLADAVARPDEPQAGAVTWPVHPAGQLAVTVRANQVTHLVLVPRLFTWPHEEEGAGYSTSANYRYR
jgi:hypothetical protein